MREGTKIDDPRRVFSLSRILFYELPLNIRTRQIHDLRLKFDIGAER